ncbi:hypothetical protein [Paenibacillus favisporus]
MTRRQPAKSAAVCCVNLKVIDTVTESVRGMGKAKRVDITFLAFVV